MSLKDHRRNRSDPKRNRSDPKRNRIDPGTRPKSDRKGKKAEAHKGSAGKKNPKAAVHADNAPRKDPGNLKVGYTDAKIAHGLQNGTLKAGLMRISANYANEAYVVLDGESETVFIPSKSLRKAALQNDRVAVKVLPSDQWKMTTSSCMHLRNLKSNSIVQWLTRKLKLCPDEPRFSYVFSNRNANYLAVLGCCKFFDVNSKLRVLDLVIRYTEKCDLGEAVDLEDSLKHLSAFFDYYADNIKSSKEESRYTIETLEAFLFADPSEPCSSTFVDSLSQLEIGQLDSAAPTRVANEQRGDDDVAGTPGPPPVILRTDQLLVPGKFDLMNPVLDVEAEDIKEFYDKRKLPTGRIVAILSMCRTSRSVIGVLRVQNAKQNIAVLRPVSPMSPSLLIDADHCPKGFFKNPSKFVDLLYNATVNNYEQNTHKLCGTLGKEVGKLGEVEAETAAVLVQNGFSVDAEFSRLITDQLPAADWSIPVQELNDRVDLRKEVIFTIDPSTARDLDDAVSCKQLSDGLFEVGVHIADVTYFLPEESDLDEAASERATTVYLVHKAIPMLPARLSSDLCSLTPHTDKLTFSVTWTMDSQGQITATKVFRSVMRSCVQLSYEHAQKLIDEPDVLPVDFPEVTNGKRFQDVSGVIQSLKVITANMRRRRFQNGAINLSETKPRLILDPETRVPYDVVSDVHRESNELIEELMLQANMTVAEIVQKHYPDEAMLRRHPPPLSNKMDSLKEAFSFLNLGIEPTFDAHRKYLRSLKDLDESIDSDTQRQLNVLSKIILFQMKKALYFCSGRFPEKESWRHFALSIPLYTHFTSPIRRYADVIVHRQLASVIGSNISNYKPDKDKIETVARWCNTKKAAAKEVGNASIQHHFALYVRYKGEHCLEGYVIRVSVSNFKVMLPSVGMEKDVDPKDHEAIWTSFQMTKKGDSASCTVVWKDGTRQALRLFSPVRLRVIPVFTKLAWKVTVIHPNNTGQESSGLGDVANGNEQESSKSPDDEVVSEVDVDETVLEASDTEDID